MHIHGLTKHRPVMIYVNSEQSVKHFRATSLKQEGINRAFRNKVRTSNYLIPFMDRKICLLNGKNTNKVGVEKIRFNREGFLNVTDIERTLIDIAVRPVYSGGCKEVLNAYKRAKSKISIKKLIKMLQQISYIYPYHQSIGFYMQKAKFNNDSLIPFKKLGLKNDFYLDYKMKNPNYSQEWRLYYPEYL